MLPQSLVEAPLHTAQVHTRRRNRKRMKGLLLFDILCDLSQELESPRRGSLQSLEGGRSAATRFLRQ